MATEVRESLESLKPARPHNRCEMPSFPQTEPNKMQWFGSSFNHLVCHLITKQQRNEECLSIWFVSFLEILKPQAQKEYT